MCAFVKTGRCEFLLDPNEPPFTDEEIAHATVMRNIKQDHPPGRPDQCPHTPAHTDLRECLEAIAWYFRYRSEIEAAIKDYEDQRDVA